MRIVFMGTPDFAVATLAAVVAAGHEVLLAVTQPDKPRGRGGKMQYPEVKTWALEHGIEVYQPHRIRDEQALEKLRAQEADLFLVAAFGQILPKEVLELPSYGCVNVHASLLPKYRGAAPIQWAVLNGDPISGVTTMQMGVGLDDGDMLLKREVTLAADETGGSLFDRLALVGGDLAVETIAALEAGTVTPVPQDPSLATHVGMIKKSMGQMDFSKSAVELERLIRGLNPWPSAYTHLDGKTLKVWRAKALSDAEYEETFSVADSVQENVEKLRESTPTGTILAAGEDEIAVLTGEGVLVFLEVQLEGKKRMEVADFLRGRNVEVGTLLGRE